MNKTTKIFAAALAAFFLLLLVGCGSGDEAGKSSDKPKWSEPTSIKNDDGTECVPSAENNGCRGEIYSDMNPNIDPNGEGFGTYELYGEDTNATITFTMDMKQDYDTEYTREFNKIVEDVGNIAPGDLAWGKLTIDNTEGRGPYYTTELEVNIVTPDGEQIRGGTSAASLLWMEAMGSDEVSEEVTQSLEVLAELDEETPALPGTKRTLPVLFESVVPDIKSVWLTDMEMERK